MTSLKSEIPYISICLSTDKPVKKTPYQIKGSIMRKYPKSDIVPMLNGKYRNKFLYPRVQVKILNEKIFFVGICEGVHPIKSLITDIKNLDLGDITFEITDTEINEDGLFKQTDKIMEYKFITPWVALNRASGKKYNKIKKSERNNFLNHLLGKNIIFLSNELGIELKENILSKVLLSSQSPLKIHENQWQAFEGKFQTNFILPEFIGLGNGITRGFGSFKSTKLIFDQKSMDKDFEVLNFENPIIKKTQKRKNSQPRKSKKILSEEFDIEEPGNEKNYNTLQNNFSNVNKIGKKKKNRKKQNTKTKSFSNGKNYNSEEYHKKQHSIK